MIRRKYMLFLSFFLCLNFIAFAQSLEDIIPDIERQPVVITDTLNRNYDTGELPVRSFKTDLRETYNGPEYTYNRVARSSSDNFLSRFISWIAEGLSDIFGFALSPLTIELITYIFYALIAALAIYFIIRFLGTEGFSKILGKSTKTPGTVTLEDTHIEEIDLDSFIKESLQNGNYRNALRYQYLSVLKTLSTKKIITWDFQKTNADYYREIKNLETQNNFKTVTNIYDHVWYGEFPIAQDSYEKAMQQFNLLTTTAR